MLEKIKGYDSELSQEVFLALPEEDKRFLIDYKHHSEAISMDIEMILELDHPKSEALYKWVKMNNKNKKWYLENINKIKLVPNGIEILGDIYDLEDSITSKNIGTVDEEDNKKWIRKDADINMFVNGKIIPDWTKLTSFIPLDLRQSFLFNVMGMERLYLGSGFERIVTSKGKIILDDKNGMTGRLRGVKLKEV